MVTEGNETSEKAAEHPTLLQERKNLGLNCSVERLLKIHQRMAETMEEQMEEG